MWVPSPQQETRHWRETAKCDQQNSHQGSVYGGSSRTSHLNNRHTECPWKGARDPAPPPPQPRSKMSPEQKPAGGLSAQDRQSARLGYWARRRTWAVLPGPREKGWAGQKEGQETRREGQMSQHSSSRQPRRRRHRGWKGRQSQRNSRKKFLNWKKSRVFS